MASGGLGCTCAELRRFEPGDAAGIREYYVEHGYVVVRGLLPARLVDDVMAGYRRLLRYPYYVFGSQDTNRFERLKTDA